MSKNKLYTLLFIACFFGYIWLGYALLHAGPDGHSGVSVCVFKKITGIPCPSCGTTRALQLMVQGQVGPSIMVNPFALIVGFLMAVLPVWIVADVMLRKQTLYNFYHTAERMLQIKWIAFLGIGLVLLNWIWTIYKGL